MYTIMRYSHKLDNEHNDEILLYGRKCRKWWDTLIAKDKITIMRQITLHIKTGSLTARNVWNV